MEEPKGRNRRPVIGVTGPDNGGWPAWALTAFAVRRAGGKPVRIRPSRPHSIEMLDGLVIGGGADVNPQRYKEEPVLPELRRQMRKDMSRKWRRHQLTFTFVFDFFVMVGLWLIRRALSSPFHPTPRDEAGRDALEFELLNAALKKGIPILGICRGMQLLNVSLGGSLHQEISCFYEESPHLTTIMPRKKIEIEPNSRLHSLFGRTLARVNSLHFQSVKTLGQGLHVTAVEPNGIVQAIEHEGPQFVVGVQWHPEYLPMDESQAELFKDLVAHAYHGDRSRTPFTGLSDHKYGEGHDREANADQQTPSVAFVGIPRILDSEK